MDTNTKNSFLCRQSSTRWIPTPDQIRILRDLYYNNGVRSPTAEQIQRISARLRQYGKIEGKNVFYWFQNHKARERQKKKLTMDMSNSSTMTNVDCPYSDNNKLSNTSINVPYHGFYDVRQMGGNGYGGGPVFMERSIRESCLTGGDDTVMDSNMGWMGVEPTMPWMYHYIKEEEPLISASATREVETLPLFPTHSQEEEEEEEEVDGDHQEHHDFAVTLHHSFSQQNGYHHYQYYSGNGVGASLELTLNSYYCAPPGSM